MLVGLTIGFSDVMWSQAVISAVHGTLNALFVNVTLLFFYLWMLEPKKTHRLVLTVFVFSLGLTNHHTLVQIIPAFLLAAALEHLTPLYFRRPANAPLGLFFSVLFSVCLFSLSILAYISWLASDNDLQTISQAMAWLILALVTVVSFFYLKEFRLNLFLLGAATALVVAAYGYYLMDPGQDETTRYTFATAPHWWQVGSFVHEGWLQGLVGNAHAGAAPMPRQVNLRYFAEMLALAMVALGLLYTSQLNRRMVISVFIVGWVGLVPYMYEPFASSTHPPMNWGFASLRSGFYYEVSREQYPKSLPTLIKSTFGKAIGVIPKDAQLDGTIGLPNYWERLGKTFYYYGDNLQKNFTAPLIFLVLAIFLYAHRSDWPQINWFIFLAAAFFLLGFMLLLIAPQEGFDFEKNLQYKVFHLQSHCIFVLLMGYGALALMTYLHELMPEVPGRIGALGFGVPGLFLSLLPLWSNFDGCSQAGHWFGYQYGADMMRPMDKNAIYFGGSDPGRFVPTFMAFVESQQPDKWKADWSVYPQETAQRGAGFDRRDVTVLTQNALCDTYYAHYIRDQYDPRFRPTTWTPLEKWLGRDKAYPEVPVTCVSEDELRDCWDEYQTWPEVATRMREGGPLIRSGTNDVFDINGIVAQKIFEKNKQDHTFYLEQSVPIDWMYPYLLPSGLIFKLNRDPMSALPAAAVEADKKFWDDYSQKLLADPHFHLDADAMLSFSKLAFWHADLYRWRKMNKEAEYFLRLAIRLCPQLQDAVNLLAHQLLDEKRYDEAITLVEQGSQDDPRNDFYDTMLVSLKTQKLYGQREDEVRAELAKSPYDVQLNTELARLLQDEGKYIELKDRMRTLAGLTNWTHDAMADLIGYYVKTVNNPDAAIAFLQERVKIDPSSGELDYTLATLEATQRMRDDALRDLKLALSIGGTNALQSARMDPRFLPYKGDAGFQALLGGPDTNSPATNASSTNLPMQN
jgi:tetratricopeptide (TPR) repeat protein